MNNRKTAVAGRFYPDEINELNNVVLSMLNVQPKSPRMPKALIVPHAGYIFSGQIAADAFSYLTQYKGQIKRVFLLGPSHRFPLRGCAVTDHDAFESPLGPIVIDKEIRNKLLANNEVQSINQAHQLEHSLEVQLPFLQHVLDEFQLIPILIGGENQHKIADMLEKYAQDSSSLIVVSTDLSHFLSQPECIKVDGKTIDKILSYQATLSPSDACGCSAVNGLLEYSRRQGWGIELISQRNSGEVIDNKKEVVGYASFVLF